ncbi:hypothetical protein CLAIMM_04801 [Cladophialophora immunda]|nr:hypothetical protein CLAIMM_04801 [Cladophialophora immunda]
MIHRVEECQSHELAFGTLVLPEILKIAVSYDFVRHGVCTLGARHLALLTRSASMVYVEYHHRGVALKGLRQCLETFSEEHIEAVIAASLLLSWQAPKSDEYAHTMQGICSVLHQVKTERYRSTFSHLLLPSKNTEIATQLAQMDPDTLLDRAEQAMSEMQQALGRSESYRGISLGIKELKIYVTNLRMQGSNPPSTHRQLTTLFPIRNWMFWIPNAFEQLARKDPFTMLFFACYEMIHLAIAPLLPAGNLPLALSIRPKFIERINSEFLVLAQSVMDAGQFPLEDVASTLQLFRNLMAGPLRYAKLYNETSIN